MMIQPEDTRSLPAVAIHSVILALSTIFALMGNSLVCLVFYRNRRLRTVTNFYVMSLPVADIMVSTFVLPFSTVASGYQEWPFNFAFCQFSGFTTYFWGTISINILVLTAVNRYICIVKPHLYPTLFTSEKEDTFFNPNCFAAYTHSRPDIHSCHTNFIPVISALFKLWSKRVEIRGCCFQRYSWICWPGNVCCYILLRKRLSRHKATQFCSQFFSTGNHQ